MLVLLGELPRGFSSSSRGRGHGRGYGCGQGHTAHRGKAEDKEGIPTTELGRLVKAMKVESLEIFSSPRPSGTEMLDFSRALPSRMRFQR